MVFSDVLSSNKEAAGDSPNWTEIFGGIHWSGSLLRLVYMWVRMSIFYKFSIKEYGEIMLVRPSKG
jgi:hypothetical protein